MDLRETLLKSEKVFEGRLIGVRKDEVRLPNGRMSVREVVEHPGAVAIVPLLEDDRVVLVRQFRYAVGKALMEIPAGTRHPNEPPEECAQRELREETGYIAQQLTHLTDFYVAPGYSTELIHLFVATGLQPAKGEQDEDELVEVVTLPLSEAVAAIERGEVQDAKTIVGLLWVWWQRGSEQVGFKAQRT